jgi:hypothetical protein
MVVPCMTTRAGETTGGPTTPPAGEDAASDRALLFDFRSPESVKGWIVVNDTVMGGRSEGGFEHREDGLVFTGRTNTDGGGFSSIRGPLPDRADLSRADGLSIRLRGAGGRSFKLDLRQTRGNQRPGVAYRADIPMQGTGDWEELRIPFTAFVASWRGQPVAGAILEPGDVTHLGLFIYDDKDGPFRLEVDRIEAYRDQD